MELRTKASRSDAVTERERENLQVAYRAACEGVVLLKNDGALPFATKTVALYGPGASMTIKGGTGSGEVNERHSVTVLEGLKNRGFTIATEKWLADFEAFYAEAKAAYQVEKRKRLNLLNLKNIMQMLFDNFRTPDGPAITDEYLSTDTDSCIYVLSRQAGEGGDRKAEKGDYLLTDEEVEAIRVCAGHYEKFVLVINSGSGMDLSALDGIEGINAILYISQLGTEGGNAVADILSGEVNPSGRLADTWAYRYEDIPFAMEYGSLNGDLENEYYKEGIFVGYRYFDSFGIEPRYPFGYGLSYTDFAICCTDVKADGTVVSLKAAVTNTGNRAGKQVVQLYVSAPEEGLNKEYQSLAAFAKTAQLEPGQTEELELTFDLRELASYRERDGAFILDSGDYVLRLGDSSRNTCPVAVLALEKETVVSWHANICPIQEHMHLKELQAPARAREVLEPGLPRIVLDCAVAPVAYTYEERPLYPDDRTRAFVEKLTDEEMVDIVVGVGMFGAKNRFDLPGSVGNTTSKFWDRGLTNVALCDGPAGLRIQKHSTVDKKGKIKPVEMAMSIFEAAPGFVKKLMTGNPRKEQSLYQFTTAFPVTAALAQSWNAGLLQEVGHAIYREMKEYGCTYWLAPAVNIHRNPLCGRNFEYYSEDPRLTGLLAAAVTRGVQAEPGFYVTVKHFACNNQEDNRNFVSSNLSERALREIYLRAFEYPVRKGGAKAIMTSYNRLNGVYTPNSHDLCTRVLRCEWGFEGVVMTDWFSTNKGQAGSALAIGAGNDLIMPGGGSFKKDILMGLKDGSLAREDLIRCCANVVKSIFDSETQREYIG